MLLASLKKSIKADKLILPGDHLLAGVSGGADSVAMLAALCHLRARHGFRITVAHLNHGIRGQAAAEDAGFVAGLAAGLGVECVTGRSDVPRRAKRKGISLEMAAREARYAFFVRTAKKAGATVIATAHTANDQAETVLLKLVRGAGMEGLSGISGKTVISGIRLIRPLLGVPRDVIIAFLNQRHLQWREDLSNRDRSFLRNRTRHELLPMLEERFNPSIQDTLCRTAQILEADNEWMQRLAEEMVDRYTLPDGTLAVDGLRDEQPAARRRVLQRWLAASGAPAEHLKFDTICRADRLLAGNRGSGAIDLPAGLALRRQYDRMMVDRTKETVPQSPFRIRLRIPGETLAIEHGFRITTTIEPGLVKDKSSTPGMLPACASIRLDAAGGRAIYVRSWKAGDRIAPSGMPGSKKVQDIFVDAKIPAARRQGVPIFECGGEILWIPRYRVARGWEITDPSLPSLHIRMEAL